MTLDHLFFAVSVVTIMRALAFLLVITSAFGFHAQFSTTKQSSNFAQLSNQFRGGALNAVTEVPVERYNV